MRKKAMKQYFITNLIYCEIIYHFEFLTYNFQLAYEVL